MEVDRKLEKDSQKVSRECNEEVWHGSLECVMFVHVCLCACVCVYRRES